VILIKANVTKSLEIDERVIRQAFQQVFPKPKSTQVSKLIKVFLLNFLQGASSNLEVHQVWEFLTESARKYSKVLQVVNANADNMRVVLA
jgi:hypothetical protein